MKFDLTCIGKNTPLRLKTLFFIIIILFNISGFTQPTSVDSVNKKQETEYSFSDIIKPTWLDLIFTNFFPVPGTRFADFSDMNFGGEVRINFMIFNIEPLWISANVLADWNKTNSNRLDRIVDVAASIGVGWRFPLIERVYFTPRLSYGYMEHLTYGDYYNDPSIYPGDPRAGKKRNHYFLDQYMHYEAELAYDLSPEFQYLKCEVFISPSFIHFIEKKRQGYEYGYMIGTRMKFDTISGEKQEKMTQSKTTIIESIKEWGLYGTIYDKETNESISGVDITIIGGQTEPLQLTTNLNGEFRQKLEPETDYEIILKKQGYFTIRCNFSTKKKQPGWYNIKEYMAIEFQKAKVGAVIEFGNIFFDLGSATIRKDAMPYLDKMVQFLKDNPYIKVELGAHTDTRGSYESQDILSQKRAENSAAYLISKGISPSRITAKGYGKRKIKNHCVDGVPCSEAEHQINRRTELVVKEIILESN